MSGITGVRAGQSVGADSFISLLYCATASEREPAREMVLEGCISLPRNMEVFKVVRELIERGQREGLFTSLNVDVAICDEGDPPGSPIRRLTLVDMGGSPFVGLPQIVYDNRDGKIIKSSAR